MKNVRFLLLTAILTITHYISGQDSIFRSNTLSENTNLFMFDLPSSLKNAASKIHSDGTIVFKPESNLSVEQILSLIDGNALSSYSIKRERPSRLNQNVVYIFYEQYYNNIRLEEGGYTIKKDLSNDRIIHFSPNIIACDNISTVPIINVGQLAGILQVESVNSSELLITEKFGQSKLVWLCKIQRGLYPSNVWVDATNGNILEEINSLMEIFGTTYSYGHQLLNDKTDGDTTTMEWPNNTDTTSLRIFESNPSSNPVNPSQ